MSRTSEDGFGTIQLDFDASIRLGFGGARLTSDTVFSSFAKSMSDSGFCHH
jgi:hypothetical protein